MNTNNRHEVWAYLVAELKGHELLGFDTAAQAVAAILTHDDWASRFDCLDEESFRLRVLSSIYRRLRLGA